MAKETFEMLRPKIDEAIRAGLSVSEFLELNDMTRQVWYMIKPKSFHWTRIQQKLGVERPKLSKKYKNKPTPKVQEKKQEEEFKSKDNFYTSRAIEVSKQMTKTLQSEGFSHNIKPLMLEFGMLQKFIQSNVCD